MAWKVSLLLTTYRVVQLRLLTVWNLVKLTSLLMLLKDGRDKIIGKNYDASKTERENMELSGHALVWDCGHAVYTID